MAYDSKSILLKKPIKTMMALMATEPTQRKFIAQLYTRLAEQEVYNKNNRNRKSS